MPNGFIGTPTANYLEDVANTLSVAGPIHSRDPFQTLSNRAVPPPTLPERINTQPPHPPETARSGRYFTGAGSSENIVVEEIDYHSILQLIDQIDDDIGYQLYQIAIAIDTMCETSYILPRTVPKCLVISMGIKMYFTMKTVRLH